MKSCTRCSEVKDDALFRPNPKMVSGLDSWCKACASAHVSALRKARVASDSPVSVA